MRRIFGAVLECMIGAPMKYHMEESLLKMLYPFMHEFMTTSVKILFVCVFFSLGGHLSGRFVFGWTVPLRAADGTNIKVAPIKQRRVKNPGYLNAFSFCNTLSMSFSSSTWHLLTFQKIFSGQLGLNPSLRLCRDNFEEQERVRGISSSPGCWSVFFL